MENRPASESITSSIRVQESDPDGCHYTRSGPEPHTASEARGAEADGPAGGPDEVDS